MSRGVLGEDGLPKPCPGGPSCACGGATRRSFDGVAAAVRAVWRCARCSRVVADRRRYRTSPNLPEVRQQRGRELGRRGRQLARAAVPLARAEEAASPAGVALIAAALAGDPERGSPGRRGSGGRFGMSRVDAGRAPPRATWRTADRAP